MKDKPKRELIPQPDVLAWLQAHHPELHAGAELDRAWVWITTSLKGDEHLATRESIKQYGFIFNRHGGHKLSSGALGTWGHSCEKPIAFKRKGGGKPKARDNDRLDPIAAAADAQTEDTSDAAALAFAMG
jgi:hypothetical protein